MISPIGYPGRWRWRLFSKDLLVLIIQRALHRQRHRAQPTNPNPRAGPGPGPGPEPQTGPQPQSQPQLQRRRRSPLLSLLYPPLKRQQRLLLRTVLGTLSWVPIYVFATTHIGQVMTVKGSSMSPSLSPEYGSTGRKDRVWAWMYNPSNTNPNGSLHRGDIVAFWSPLDPRKMVIKRVVGLEGDVVRLRGTSEPVHVPPGHVWVEGDDGLHSRDSNLYGPISMNLIVARITYIIWPLGRMGRLKWEDWKPREKIVLGRSEKSFEEWR